MFFLFFLEIVELLADRLTPGADGHPALQAPSASNTPLPPPPKKKKNKNKQKDKQNHKKQVKKTRTKKTTEHKVNNNNKTNMAPARPRAVELHVQVRLREVERVVLGSKNHKHGENINKIHIKNKHTITT